MAFLVRMTLPDRPGSLGAVATALGMAHVDIISVDVVERGPAGAVDDIVVELPSGAMPDRLVTAAQSVPGVTVESVRPYPGGLDIHREFALIEDLAANPEHALALLVDDAPEVFRAGWALVSEVGADGGMVAAASIASPSAAGESVCVDGALDKATRLVADRVPPPWSALETALVAAPIGPELVVVVGRPGGPAFRDSEVLRLGHLAGIVASVFPGTQSWGRRGAELLMRASVRRPGQLW
jgi:hypothetical protein